MVGDNLIKYRGNYCFTNQTFVFQNFPEMMGRNTLGEYESVYNVVKNILLRGKTTLMSEFLQNEIGSIHKDPDFRKYVGLISSDIPQWDYTIKGDEINNFYPAKQFFYENIPRDLTEFTFVQQLIIPEALISDIVTENSHEFINQQVDFYLPQARLVIEIDGQQHKLDEINRISDIRRDEYLLRNSIQTIRIDTKDLMSRSSRYFAQIKKIKALLNANKQLMMLYSNPTMKFITPFKMTCLKSTAIFRFELLILDLLLSQNLKLKDKKWSINIKSDDFPDNTFPILAIEDLLLWIENICKMAKLPFNKPLVEINWVIDRPFSISKKIINVDFSLFKRWSEKAISDVITVRTDYYGNHNYYQLACSDPIRYKLVYDGEESDVPSLHFFLKNLFGFDMFNDGQLPIVFNALQGETTIGLLPTGSGKSLCYQLIAMLQPGITIVVCPIKALMYDQKENLDLKFITNSAYISGDMKPDEKERVQDSFGNGKYQILWISPERFQSKSFRNYLSGVNKKYLITFAVIDEVHCLSEWGHDFRISYLNLIKTINNFCPSATLMGLTATASSFVIEDIKIEFATETKNIKTLKSFSRPELNFQVFKTEDLKETKLNKLYDVLTDLSVNKDVFNSSESGEKKAGLIFTPNVNGDVGCYDIANKINTKLSKQVNWYSGKTPSKKIYEKGVLKSDTPVLGKDEFIKYKDQVQKDFKKDKFPLLVATKAFGMGIDKSNIRYTIHYGIPGSLESLYQEAGRAGRDRKSSDCYVIYTPNIDPQFDLNPLFHIDTTVEDIKKILKTSKLKNDVMSIFYMWQSGLDDVENELETMLKVFNEIIQHKSNKVDIRKIGLNLDTTQKAIYRLSLLDILKDWTIENWDANKGIIEVVSNEINEESIFKALNKYISKYEPSFNLYDNAFLKKNYPQFDMILSDDKIDVVRKAGLILIKWNYEHIVYNRRQSIKTIIDLCDNYENGEQFKETIERYFKYSDKQFLLDEIAHKPNDLDNWLSVFLNDLDGKNESFIDSGKLLDLEGTLTRLLESYRYNEGLNWLIGLTKMIIGDFSHVNGKARFVSSLEHIQQYDSQSKVKILEDTLKVASNYLDEEKKELLSESLCTYFPDNIEKIYASLGDKLSLSLGLDNGVGRLKKIGEKMR